MSNTLHVTSGDNARDILAQSGVPGEVFVWHDILYDGPRCPGWPDEGTLIARAAFLEEITGGGLDRQRVLDTLRRQYRRLADAAPSMRIVLWFDACLFDLSMLTHILTCLRHQDAKRVELLCIDAFPGIEPFHGLGQLTPNQLGSLYDSRQPVTAAQFNFAVLVDEAFATQDVEALSELTRATGVPLPGVPAAAARWLQERPDPVAGMGRLESLALAAIRAGCETPGEVFASVAAAEAPPQFWGDTTLWAKINALAKRDPPLVEIDGPAKRLPQWNSDLPLDDFRITTVDRNGTI